MEDQDEMFGFGGIAFEWNARKAASDFRKHQISFTEGATVFADDEALLLADPDHSQDESRFLLMGVSKVRRILVVSPWNAESGSELSARGWQSGRRENNMKKAASREEVEMRAEYDFSVAVKNPYAKRVALGSNTVMIKPEIFAAFPSGKAVNDALELLMRTGVRAPRKRPASRPTQAVRTR